MIFILFAFFFFFLHNSNENFAEISRIFLKMSQSKQKKIKQANVLVLKFTFFENVYFHPYFGEQILPSHFLDKFCEISPTNPRTGASGLVLVKQKLKKFMLYV